MQKVLRQISRRRFIQGTAVMMSAHSAWGLPAHVLEERAPIGLQLYSVGVDLEKNPASTLRQIRAIGYERVETAGFAGLTASAFRDQLVRANLICLSTHLPVGDHDLSPLFEDAHAVGARYVVSSALLPPKNGAPTLDDYFSMAERLNDLGRKAKQGGLQCCYHNHNFEFRKLDGDRFGYDLLLQHTDPELVAFELDCGWMVAAGHSPIDYFHRFPGRYRMLHIKDFVATEKPSTSLAKDKRPQGVELGRGHINYKPILLAAAAAGIQDHYVEQEPPFVDMPALDAVKVDYEDLRAL